MKTTSMKFSRRTLMALAAAAVALPFVAPADAFAGTVEEARARGKVVIGIQGDNSPWGFVNSSGVQDGLDADIGKAFADYLCHQNPQALPIPFAPMQPLAGVGLHSCLYEAGFSLYHAGQCLRIVI